MTTPDLCTLMATCGCLEYRFIPIGDDILARLRFATETLALVHRAKAGCGGWVLGPYLFPGSWTPSAVILNAPGVEGTLR